MPTYSTPGVYVEEVSKFPPSVAEVATAIPAFIGYTTKRPGPEPGPQIAAITNMLEYEAIFGKAASSKFKVTVKKGSDSYKIESVALDEEDSVRRTLYYAMQHYFSNGGGRCYVVSIGAKKKSITIADFTKGFEALKKQDEPTILVMPEAVEASADDHGTICQGALAHCNTMKDRFAILDVPMKGKGVDKDATNFRDKVSSSYLMYGAAYYPHLVTTLPYHYEDDEATVEGYVELPVVADPPEPPEVPEPPESPTVDGTSQPASKTLSEIKNANTALYNAIKKRLSKERITLPPSAAMAGIYASVDRNRGVWKAPANVPVSAVSGPKVQVTNDQQDRLNIDATSGKSINAIRSFVGKGTLVWGARTLAGNDNEWRYVPTRRLFITIEESAQKSTAWAVFEPNDANTWLKVKGMLESYLYKKWQDGALQGATPEAAYYVEVGLGKTMTAQDILEGYMIVEIGIAAVRPAEFIILRFSHKLPEA